MSNDQQLASPGGDSRGPEPTPSAPAHTQPAPAPAPAPIISGPERNGRGDSASESSVPTIHASAGSAGTARLGWAPPPKPALFPLRPLDIGAILGAAFKVLRRNPKATFGAALVILGPAYVLFTLVFSALAFTATSRIANASEEDFAAIAAGAAGLGIPIMIVSALIALAASAILQGVIVLAITREAVGETLSLRALWRLLRGRVAALLGWAAIVSGTVAFLFGSLTFIFIFLIAAFSVAGGLLGAFGVIAGGLLGAFGVIAITVFLLWFGVKLSLVPNALVVERLSIRRAIARSWSLTRGYFWRTFGITALVTVIFGTISQGVNAPLNQLGPRLIKLVDPQNQNGGGNVAATALIAIFAVILVVVFQCITSVVQSATSGLIYLDLRIRKEGLDLELVRYVEARHVGDTSVPDPLRSREPGASIPETAARQ